MLPLDLKKYIYEILIHAYPSDFEYNESNQKKCIVIEDNFALHYTKCNRTDSLYHSYIFKPSQRHNSSYK